MKIHRSVFIATYRPHTDKTYHMILILVYKKLRCNEHYFLISWFIFLFIKQWQVSSGVGYDRLCEALFYHHWSVWFTVIVKDCRFFVEDIRVTIFMIFFSVCLFLHSLTIIKCYDIYDFNTKSLNKLRADLCWLKF